MENNKRTKHEPNSRSIRIKHRLTHDIQVRDSIRQGGVLSVAEYSNLIDDLAKTTQKDKIDMGTTNITGCLKWMDDVALFHTEPDQLQEMLNITEEIAQRYHIKFGKEKNQIITISTKEPKQHNLGEMNLDSTNKYKYLGVVINGKGIMEDHMLNIKGKVEASLQTILNIAGYNSFNKIQMDRDNMETDQHMHNPNSILYAAEAWIPTHKEVIELQKIVENAIKRIL